jgi:hypothetical protein
VTIAETPPQVARSGDAVVIVRAGVTWRCSISSLLQFKGNGDARRSIVRLHRQSFLEVGELCATPMSYLGSIQRERRPLLVAFPSRAQVRALFGREAWSCSFATLRLAQPTDKQVKTSKRTDRHGAPVAEPKRHIQRRGRPREGRELEAARVRNNADRAWLKKQLSRIPPKDLQELSEDERKALKKASQFSKRVRLAIAMLKGIERGYPRTRFKDLIEELRVWAKVNGPRDQSLKPWEFLEEFIQEHAPNLQWRDINDVKALAEMDEEMANENARLEVRKRARKERFVTPIEPDAGWLSYLRRLNPNDPTTWPTLFELKLATAIPQRVIEKIVAGSVPKKGEIVTIPLRHKVSPCGAFPKRYGPRPVMGVLGEFLKRLPNYAIEDAEREQARKVAVTAKRSLSSKLACSRSGT